MKKINSYKINSPEFRPAIQHITIPGNSGIPGVFDRRPCFLQHVRIASIADRRTILSVCMQLFVRPSRSGVCPDECHPPTIVRFLASGRGLQVGQSFVVFLKTGKVLKFIRIFEGDHPSQGVKVRH